MEGPSPEGESWSPGEDKRGLECRHCGCRHFRVVCTRRGWGGKPIRRRKCRHFGKRMTTRERPIEGCDSSTRMGPSSSTKSYGRLATLAGAPAAGRPRAGSEGGR